MTEPNDKGDDGIEESDINLDLDIPFPEAVQAQPVEQDTGIDPLQFDLNADFSFFENAFDRFCQNSDSYSL